MSDVAPQLLALEEDLRDYYMVNGQLEQLFQAAVSDLNSGEHELLLPVSLFDAGCMHLAGVYRRGADTVNGASVYYSVLPPPMSGYFLVLQDSGQWAAVSDTSVSGDDDVL
eukprot:583956-Amphidinium_carterae.1